MDSADDSVVRKVILHLALQLIEVLLVSDLRRSAPLDPLRPVLFGPGALFDDEEPVHFPPQSNDVGDRFAGRLVLEFANHFFVGGVEDWTRLVKRGEVEVLQLGEELLLDVGRLHTVHERVGVCEEHLRRRVLLPEVVVVEPVHVQLRQFQYAEADLEGLVDERLDFPHLDTHQLLIEDFEAHAVWLID